jgi:hypothetical protein
MFRVDIRSSAQISFKKLNLLELQQRRAISKLNKLPQCGQREVSFPTALETLPSEQ